MTKLDINLMARSDLANIKIYLRECFALDAYYKIEEKIFERFQMIAKFPESGVVFKIKKFKNFRFYYEKPYYIFYTYSNNTVTIQRIIHGAQDIEKALS